VEPPATRPDSRATVTLPTYNQAQLRASAVTTRRRSGRVNDPGQVRRRRDGQRRPVVLGQVVGVKAQPVVSLDQLQPLGDIRGMRVR
jgi:hypothetical protein